MVVFQYRYSYIYMKVIDYIWVGKLWKYETQDITWICYTISMEIIPYIKQREIFQLDYNKVELKYKYIYKEVTVMKVPPSITFLTDWYTILYFAVLISQLTSVYSNAKKGKNRLAIASIIFIIIVSYLYLSKYYMLK